MPPLKKWQEIVRQTHIDEGVVLREAIKEHIKIMRMIGNDEHMKKPGEFLALMAALGSTIGQAEALARKSNDILENNSKPTPDEGRQALMEHLEDLGNRARRRE